MTESNRMASNRDVRILRERPPNDHIVMRESVHDQRREYFTGDAWTQDAAAAQRMPELEAHELARVWNVMRNRHRHDAMRADSESAGAP